VKAVLSVVVTILFLNACGDSESVEQKVCAVEIERKAEEKYRSRRTAATKSFRFLASFKAVAMKPA
jgi:hypothetical protein